MQHLVKRFHWDCREKSLTPAKCLWRWWALALLKEAEFMARLLCSLLLLWTFSEAAGWGRLYPSGCAPPYFLLCRRRDFYSLNVFNGSIHMQSMDFFRAAVLWVFGGHFQITKTTSLWRVCILSLELPGWHTFCVWQVVLHMKDCSKGIAGCMGLPSFLLWRQWCSS